MAFTLAHPAAVIFSKDKRFNLMGLILGSMSPDFIYFILFSPSSNIGHTLLGLIFVRNIPSLKNGITLLNNSIPAYKLLQHGSTIVGFLILFIFLINIKDKNKKQPGIAINKFSLFGFIFLVQIITLVLSYLFCIITETNFGIGRFVVTFINGLFLGYLFTGLTNKNRYQSYRL